MMRIMTWYFVIIFRLIFFFLVAGPQQNRFKIAFCRFKLKCRDTFSIKRHAQLHFRWVRMENTWIWYLGCDDAAATSAAATAATELLWESEICMKIKSKNTRKLFTMGKFMPFQMSAEKPSNKHSNLNSQWRSLNTLNQ